MQHTDQENRPGASPAEIGSAISLPAGIAAIVCALAPSQAALPLALGTAGLGLNGLFLWHDTARRTGAVIGAVLSAAAVFIVLAGGMKGRIEEPPVLPLSAELLVFNDAASQDPGTVPSPNVFYGVND